ncbi:hypothetical protein KY339_00115 [Candidatus Woesearchaeota archaeon]|nr:hypothetical protein [Candidatus Woesearchaeota archaeon]
MLTDRLAENERYQHLLRVRERLKECSRTLEMKKREFKAECKLNDFVKLYSTSLGIDEISKNIKDYLREGADENEAREALRIYRELSESWDGKKEIRECKDFLFEECEGGPVTVDVHVGPDYRSGENPDAREILKKIFDEYCKLEYPNYKENHWRLIEDLEKKLKEEKHGFLFAVTNWRLGVHPLKKEEDWDNVLGFEATFLHNQIYPKKNGTSHDNEESQHRYRTALNEIEIFLIEQGTKYEIHKK